MYASIVELHFINCYPVWVNCGGAYFNKLKSPKNPYDVSALLLIGSLRWLTMKKRSIVNLKM